MNRINRRSFLIKSVVSTAGLAPGIQLLNCTSSKDNYSEPAFNEIRNTLENPDVWDKLARKKLQHPVLFFGKNDISKLKEKTKNPSSMKMWERILADCQKPNYRDAVTLALAFLITGDESFAERSKKNVMEILDVSNWDNPQFLSVNPRLFSCAIIYDWLYDYLSEDEKQKIRKTAVEKGIMLTYNAAQEHLWWTDWSRCNWGMVIFSSAASACAAFLGDEKGIDKYLKFFTNKLMLWLEDRDIDGGWGEGVSYYSYAWFNGLRFIDSLKNVSKGMINLFKHPFLEKTFQYPIYLTMPDEISFVPFSNLGGGINSTNQIMRKLASEFKNPYAQWHADKREGRNAFEFIWYAPEIKPEAPNELPKAKLFRTIHWAVMRSGWDNENDILFAIKGGHNDWDHHHIDHNTFILSAYGERLIIDQGYAWKPEKDVIPYANDTIAHNTLLVNGEGQLGGYKNYSGTRGKYEHFTSLSDFVHNEYYDGITGDARHAYSPDLLREYIRQVMFIRPDYFVIFDSVESNENSIFEWLFHTFGIIDVKRDFVIIKQRDVTLLMKILMPQPFNYKFSEQSMKGSNNSFTNKFTDRYIRLSPAGKTRYANFLAILYPVESSNEASITKILSNVNKIEEKASVGFKIQSKETTDTVLFDKRIAEHRESRTIEIDGISTDGHRCIVRKGIDGEVKMFAIHGGNRLSIDNIAFISAPQLVTAAFTLDSAGMQGYMNLVATSTVQIHLPKKPIQVYAGDRAIDFTYNDKNQSVTFALPFGQYEILIK